MEFGRKPKSLDDLKRWKAIEFRQFVLYTSIVVLKEILHEDYYYHFLLFHCSYRVLLSKNFKSYVPIIENTLKDFVIIFETLYPSKMLRYNVHNMLHLTQCVEHYGNLQNISSYKFENFLQQVKKKTLSLLISCNG